jgi:AcrR family transcriptional regulator
LPEEATLPRRPDPKLEGKILEAARKLWKKGGEHRLTLRAVARAAGTNTPAVYRRFRDRDDILRALLQRIRLEIAGAMEGAQSPEEGCRRYLDYAVSHPHEYELFYQQQYELFYSPRSVRAGVKSVNRPTREAMNRLIAERLGGAGAGQERLLMALWMLTHGAAMLIIAKEIPEKDAEAARAVVTETVAALLRDARRATP